MSSETDKDQAARDARAAKLRQRIDRLKRGSDPGQPAPPPSNPRDFVEKRMREEQEKGKKGAG